MCIRDSYETAGYAFHSGVSVKLVDGKNGIITANDVLANICLLYTSDAADERSSVDLGGRRIIKKKKKKQIDSKRRQTNT